MEPGFGGSPLIGLDAALEDDFHSFNMCFELAMTRSMYFI